MEVVANQTIGVAEASQMVGKLPNVITIAVGTFLNSVSLVEPLVTVKTGSISSISIAVRINSGL